MKKIIFLLLLIVIITAGYYGFQFFQPYFQATGLIKTGDSHFQAGEYQKAILAYKKANLIQPTTQADERIESAKRMLDRKAEVVEESPAESVVRSDTTTVSDVDISEEDTTETIEVVPSFEPGPAVSLTIPDPTGDEELKAFLKTQKFSTPYATMAVLLDKAENISEPIAAQIFDHLYSKHEQKLNQIRGGWPQSRIILHNTPTEYQKTADFGNSRAYLDVEKEKLRLHWTANNTVYDLYLDQMDDHSLYSMYHARQSIIQTALNHYEKLTTDQAKDNYLDQVASQLKLRKDQVREAILQARPDLAKDNQG